MPHQHSQSDWSAWTYSVAPTDDFAAQYTQLPVPEYPFLADTMKAYQVQHNHLVHHQQMSRTTESKPRLSKEEVEVLEAEFQKNHKPNSSTKKALAESMRVDHARINVITPNPPIEIHLYIHAWHVYEVYIEHG